MEKEKAERIVNLWVTKEVSQEEFELLVDYVMEVGGDFFKRSSILKRINRGLKEEVFKEMDL